ncbi:hypothetical protein TSIB_0641 [Thermococcus sibiricus MM 739]|uniref:Uncharacterized protein n=1 Tax=Thermococcus sibiricus (strain DSM 12597 / MM 739) TaxID=604354 RepID=C6A261_THESM|nr:hypothetical protein TSIB_0641 [Thermococcus sibiricus MM 739]
MEFSIIKVDFLKKLAILRIIIMKRAMIKKKDLKFLLFNNYG